jgi:hypothetical protein
MSNANQKLVLTLQDLQVLLNYLSSRPYSEVFQVIEVVKKARTLDSVLAEEASEDVPTPKDVTPEKAPEQQGA